MKFDSNLELDCYKLLEKFKIPFKWQVEYELQPGIKGWNGKAVRRIYMVIDFVIKMPDNTVLLIDTKGFPTDTSKLKYKILEYKMYRSDLDYEIHWLKKKNDVKNFVIDLYDKLKKYG
jgi:hypothetical protein